MRVTAILGRRGDVICRFNGITGLFDRRGPQPEPNTEVDVMLCTPIYPKVGGDGAEKPITTFVVRPITVNDILVDHMGFETAGSMCSTTANICKATSRRLKEATGRDLSWITPGRTPIITAENINSRREAPRTRGKAFVSIADIRAGMRRILGVPELDMLRPDIRERMQTIPY